VQEAIEMYQKLHMWDEALSLAAAKAHPGLTQLKEAHMAWLMDSGQFTISKKRKEKEKSENFNCE